MPRWCSIDFSLSYSFCLRHLVVRCVTERQISRPVHCDAIFRIGQVFGREPEVDRVARDVVEQSQRERARSRAASRLCTSPPPTCRPSGCCPSETRTRPFRNRNHSSRSSSGRMSGSARCEIASTACCCGTCSCAPPGPSRWRDRSGACRWPTSAAASRCLPRRMTTTTMSPRERFLSPPRPRPLRSPIVRRRSCRA